MGFFLNHSSNAIPYASAKFADVRKGVWEGFQTRVAGDLDKVKRVRGDISTRE